jgi:hypothetical protein
LNPAVFDKTVKAIVGLAVHGFVLTALTASAIDMLPYSLRQTWYIEDEARPYWEIRVTCSDHKTFRYMVRYDESAPWCAKKAPNMCFDDKLDVAFEICKDSYSTIVAESKKSQSLKTEEIAQQDRLRSQLLAQEARLQERRENLNKRKAELQRKERELKARELDLLERKSKLQ